MKRNLSIIALLFLLYSCREAPEISYSTDALDCVTQVINASEQKNDQETLTVLNKYKKDFKFADDLGEMITDRQALQKAEGKALKGQLTEAYSIIEERITERGYSEVLDESLKRINAGLKFQKFNSQAQQLEINEAAREFAKLQAHTFNYFGENREYKAWLTEQQEKLSRKAEKDRQEILRSLEFTADFLSLNSPEHLDILLLEMATVEKTVFIPNQISKKPPKIATLLKKKGLEKTHDEFYQNKNLISIPSNLREQLLLSLKAATSGDTVKTISLLQELQAICHIEESIRRQILKSLFIAKGWNSASLINREFVDVSFLLETIYKANK